MANRILILNQKHCVVYYDISTEEMRYAAFLEIVASNLDQGYYIEGHDDNHHRVAKRAILMQDGALAQRLCEMRSGYEYEEIDTENVIDAFRNPEKHYAIVAGDKVTGTCTGDSINWLRDEGAKNFMPISHDLYEAELDDVLDQLNEMWQASKNHASDLVEIL